MVEIQTASPEAEIEASRMTLGEHLTELRTRLIRSTLMLLVAFIVCFANHTKLDSFVQEPYEYARDTLNAKSLVRAEEAITAEGADPEEWKNHYAPGYPEIKELKEGVRVPEFMKGDRATMGFIYPLKVSFYFSLLLAGPFLLWQMWGFIAAGLYRHEKKVVHAYFPISVLLFFFGVVFGYEVMVPNALFFLAEMSVGIFEWYQSIDDYWTFLVALTLAQGVVFQLPVVMVGISRVGLVDPKSYGKYRPHMIVGSLILAALLTPPDPFTQLMMAGPIALLYELGHWAARIIVKEPIEKQSE